LRSHRNRPILRSPLLVSIVALTAVVAVNPGLAQQGADASPGTEASDGAAAARRAMELHRAGDFAAAAPAFAQAYELGHEPGSSAYNAACGYARLNDVDAGIAWLEKALAAGADVLGLLAHDSDLDNLRSDARFQKLLDDLRAKVAPTTRPPAYEAPRGDAVAADLRWPSFRGPQAGGVGAGSTPVEWSVADGTNVRWKTALPGLGHSSPVVWGERLFVTTAISQKRDPELRVGLYGDIASVEDDTVHRWQVLAIDRRDGTIEWVRTARRAVPAFQRHTKASHANSTPATDGRHVVAMFGTEGLFCYDMDGELLWHNDLGMLDSGYYLVPSAQWGFGSSPVIHGDRVFVQADVQAGSFLAAFDIDSGEQVWRSPRDEVPTWSSPTVVTETDPPVVIVNGYKHIGGYDLDTGAVLWRMRGGGDIPVPTPVVGHGFVFITNAHGAAPIYAIRLDARGDISLAEGTHTNDHIAWSQNRGGAYMQTPLVYGDYLYVCRDNGVLSAYEARTGTRLYQQRVAAGSGFTASMVAADGKIYATAETGEVYVFKAGPEYELLAQNDLDEVSMATPAIAR